MSGFRFFYKTVENSSNLPALLIEIGSLLAMAQSDSLESPALPAFGRGGVNFPSDVGFFIGGLFGVGCLFIHLYFCKDPTTPLLPLFRFGLQSEAIWDGF
ncbi:hypothetical protein CEXT_636171 [Caerostris extrusa]|uniref:Uncharacterized protein n=1 Tax=Caerostris extrusa TaxID=172846 RepID=A0AAV4T964_CAEEX|nr:hypothetical protein CEXT_636171 [Caerostris extrusa]